MATVRWLHDPTDLRAARVRLDNLALVPASLLPYKAHYQRLANQLPPGAVLIILPSEEGPERAALTTAAERFLAKGHPVTTLPADEVVAGARRPRPVRPTALPMPVEATGVAPAETAPTSSPPPTWSAGDLPPFTHELRLVQVDASQHPAQFWVLQWHPTLFGGAALVEVQGRVGHTARARVLLQAEGPQLDAATVQLVRRRLQTGYQIADWQ